MAYPPVISEWQLRIGMAIKPKMSLFGSAIQETAI